MADLPRQAVEHRDFRGMSTNSDPNDLTPGVSRLQKNVNGYKRGQLEIRRGLREVTFEDDDE